MPGGMELLFIVFIVGIMIAVVAGAVFVGIRSANRKRPPNEQ